MNTSVQESNKLLHQLLLEDEEATAKGCITSKAALTADVGDGGDGKGSIDSEQAINSALRELGVLPLSQNDIDRGVQPWQRPIPTSLLSLPIVTPPYTRLAPRSTVPDGMTQLHKQTDADSTDTNSDPLVEVCLPPQDNVENLTRRPFISGLSNDAEIGENEGDEIGIQEDDHQSCKNALEVFKKGALASWRDGTLLTSPPGVSFEIGIDFDDIYEDVDAGEFGCDLESKEEVEDEIVDEDGEKPSFFASASGTGSYESSPVVNQIWDKSYFEEDSLFDELSSSSSSSGDSESDSCSDSGSESQSTFEPDGIDKKPEEKEEEDMSVSDSDDLEVWLSEITESQTLNRKGRKIPTQAGKNEGEASSSTRKSWAVTTYLPTENYHSVVQNPAIKYPFELDEFQKQAVLRLERDECIFVAAHTSAGKTVCAEYAIALAKKHCTRAVYTSPIKALSNQKYRDFSDKFGDDVGLITGDMQVNPDASCLIMTTEILRSMLYRGADLVRDIEWVIFDEVHYINDSERGVVWEEVIIMLPEYTKLIFLSATTPNTIEFSDWIGKTKRKPVHVIRTDYRPVPLSHHLYTNYGPDGHKLHSIKLGQGGFLEKGWKQASQSLLPMSERDKKQQKKTGKSGGGSNKTKTPYSRSTGSKHSAWQQSGTRQDWTSLVKYLQKEDKMPTVVFSFSKKKCEEIANMLNSLDLNTAAERAAAHLFTVQTMARLSPKDASLPQVITTCEMVKRGIGVHHGGLLPILKEMVELLFSRNLIKVLFATETFAMGVNMPTKAVVFNSIRKHDGTEFRVLEPGEYTQMAGRAGRRGLDKVGTVIICCFGEQPPPMVTLRNMLTGSSTKLRSKFRLTYNMILNLLRVEDMSVEGMIKRSFSEFATQRALTANEYPLLLKRGLKMLAKLDEQFQQEADTRSSAEDIGVYFDTSASLLSHNQKALSYILSCTDSTCGGALLPGRIILITAARKKGLVAAPAIVVKSPTSDKERTNTSCVCIVLLPKTYISSSDNKEGKEYHLNYIGLSMSRHYAIYEIGMNEILLVSSVKHKIRAEDLYKEETKLSGLSFNSAKPLKSREVDDFGFFGGMKPLKKDDFGFGGIVPRGNKKAMERMTDFSSNQSQVDEVMEKLLRVEEMESKGTLGMLDLTGCLKRMQQGEDVLRFRTTFDRIQELTERLRSFQSHYSPCLEQHYKAVERKESLRTTIQTLRHLLSNEALQLFPDFLQRKSLLKTLNYVDDLDTVCVKGRVACEVNTCEELIVTEMVFEGILNELEPAEIVACLSSLVFQEKSQDEDLDSELPERLRHTITRMKSIANNLGELQKSHGLPIEPKDYVERSMKFGLVHVVYEWALGVPFKNICELTGVQEGSIVRCITRLDELCREVRNCSRVVGNPTLYAKMEEASSSIKRDIVFASSLYIN